MDIVALRQRACVRAAQGLEAVWRDYVAWLVATFPRVAANLQPPDPNAANALAELGRELGAPVPEEMLALYRVTGGESPTYERDEDTGAGVLFGDSLMRVPEIIEWVRKQCSWRTYDAAGASVDDADHGLPEQLDPTRRRAGDMHRLWIPFADAAGGNYLAIDLAPGPAGTVGQVINLGRDQHRQFVVSDTIAEHVALLHELGLAGIVHVIEGEAPDDVFAFGPTELCVIDQLCIWFYGSD